MCGSGTHKNNAGCCNNVLSHAHTQQQQPHRATSAIRCCSTSTSARICSGAGCAAFISASRLPSTSNSASYCFCCVRAWEGFVLRGGGDGERVGCAATSTLDAAAILRRTTQSDRGAQKWRLQARLHLRVACRSGEMRVATHSPRSGRVARARSFPRSAERRLHRQRTVMFSAA